VAACERLDSQVLDVSLSQATNACLLANILASRTTTSGRSATVGIDPNWHRR